MSNENKELILSVRSAADGVTMNVYNEGLVLVVDLLKDGQLMHGEDPIHALTSMAYLLTMTAQIIAKQEEGNNNVQ